MDFEYLHLILLVIDHQNDATIQQRPMNHILRMTIG